MLDINYVRSHPEEIRQSLLQRNTDAPLEAALEADSRRRSLLGEVETLKA
jgi:seryl-tRNA synthetase